MFKNFTLVSASALAIMTSQAAFAQDDDEDDRGDRIVVTATRIATDVQDVPIAITAVTAEQLEAQQITTFADLGNIVPNATFRKSQGIYGAGVSVTIRGLGQTDTQFSGEPAVAYYIDDVYYPFLFGSNFDLLDLERVEVLRGPQGTLFGRNAISGAVNMVSRKPSFNEASGYAEFTTGSENRLELRAGINLPLADNLALSLSGTMKRQEGYMDLLDFTCQMYANGTPELAGTFDFASSGTRWNGNNQPKNCKIDTFGGEDVKAGRAALRWEATPGVEINISGDYSYAQNESAAEKVFEVDYQLTAGHLRGTDENGNRWGAYTGVVNEASPQASKNFITMFDLFSIPGTPFRYDERFETGDMYTTYDTFCDPLPSGFQIKDDRLKSATNPDGIHPYYNGSLYRGGNCYGREVPVENWGVTGKISVDITDEIQALAILGHREIYTFFGAGWDGTPLADSIIYHEDTMHYTSGELRLTGQYDWMDFTGGLFYYDGFAKENGQPQNVRTGTQQYQDVYYYPEAKAAYLNVTLRPYELIGFANGLSLSGGIRRSDDEKIVDYSAEFDASDPGTQVYTPGANSTAFILPIANKRWDYKLGADYQITDDILIYASAASGYRLPGFATRIFQRGQNTQQYPTAMMSYELGFKVELLDNRVRLNGNIFRMEYSQRNATFSGREPRFDPNATEIIILPGAETLVTDGPEGTEYASDFFNCIPYDAARDGAPNGSTVGIECIGRSWNYPVQDGDPIQGFELEAAFEPIDDLRINYNLGYTDRGSTTGRPIGFPDYTMSGGIQYTWDLPSIDGTITPRLDWFWISKVAWSTNYTQFDDPSRSTFNARLTYQNFEHEFDLALGVTNLTDKAYFLQKTIFIQGLGAGANIGQPSEPRQWYVTLTKRF